MALSVAQFAQVATWFDVGTSKTITGLSWSAGDTIVVFGSIENALGTLGTPTNANLTFTLDASSTSGGANECPAWLWHATAASSQSSQTITIPGPAGALHWGACAWVVTGSPSGTANATANLNESAISRTVTAGSVVIHGLADWNANATNQTPATGSGTATERIDANGVRWSVCAGDWVGTAAGTFNFGLASYAGLQSAQAVIEILAPDDGEDHSTTGTISLGLAAAGTTSKTAGTSGAVNLGLGLGDDAAKTGQTAGDTTVDLAITGTTAKIAGSTGGIGLDVDVAGTAVKIAETLADLALALDLAGTVTTSETRSTAGGITLDLLLDAAAGKDTTVAGALALALDLAGDTTKLADTAGSLGLTLDLAGTVTALGEDATAGTIALALAIVATAAKTAQTAGTLDVAIAVDGIAAKTASTTGAIGLILDTTGHTGAVPVGNTVGTIGVDLTLTGQAGKAAHTVGALALVLHIAGLVGDIAPVITGRLTVIDLTPHRTVAPLDEPRVVADLTLARTAEEALA